MNQTTGDLQTINYRQVFAWVNLFRAFRIAVDIRKMLLAGLALAALSAGDLAFMYLPFAPKGAGAANPRPRQRTDLFNFASGSGEPTLDPSRATTVPKESPFDVVAGSVDEPIDTLVGIGSNWRLVLEPLRAIFGPVRDLLKTENSWSEVAYAWTRLLWVLLVWALFGGAITRMAAVEFARDERIGLRSALSFSAGRFLSYLSAPLVPIGGFGFFWLLCLLGGLLGRIPVAGDVVVGALWILALMFGFVMVLILIGVAVGWPLMLATISTEGSDAFDGFSRSYSFVYNRPWNLLWYVVVTMAYGSAVIFFVTFATWLTVYLAGWSVAAGMGPEKTNALFQAAPQLLGGSELLGGQVKQNAASGIGVTLTGLWLHVVALLLVGFVYSYFWSAVTIIYFLLRRSDDGTDFDEVYLPAGDQPDDLLPLVGVAESDQAPIERPATGDLVTDSQAEVYSGDTETDIDTGAVPEEESDE